MAAIAVFAVRENRLLLLAVEALFALSATLGVLLVRSFFVPLELIRTGAELMSEREFTSSFREVGQPEMDALVRVYNEMVARLREERLKLQEQHFFLERILAASPAGILTLDFDGRIAQANPSAAALLETSAEGGLLAASAGPLGAALAALRVGESRVLPLQGGRRIKASRAEFFDRGFPRSFFLLEELTEELRASESAAYGKLIRMMSHEVNNSVGAVGSLLDSFRGYAGQLGDEDRDDFLAALGVAIARMERLSAFMNGFATVVRLPEPDPRPTDVRRLVDEILLLLRPELERRRVACAWERAEALAPIAPIPMDRNQMEQVLVNVFKNALESIGEDGRIALRLEREGDGAVLAVRDTGPGIPAGVEPLLFTPFFSTKRDGRGLGLTLVREILSRHGFAFGLRNAPAGGAELWIRF
ncbi:MAG TPA: ATP-binding protein [Thermoanaerobaculia bacterium]|nr:ATP-binding protein [Thermoanaerobaculia bacterium]